MATGLFWSGCLAVCLLSACCSAAGGLLRVPKVYNAIISSDSNLTPSRAYPVIQPVVHETLGYPLHHPFLYQTEYQKQPSLRQIDNADIFEVQHQQTAPAPAIEGKASDAQPDQKSPKDHQKQTQEAPKQPEGSAAPPSNNEETGPTENPLKLNEFGLPPSLVPIGQAPPPPPRLNFPPNFDPYAVNPYYADPYNGLVLPNLFSPYYQAAFGGGAQPQQPGGAFDPYLRPLPPSFYDLQPQQPQSEGGEQAQQRPGLLQWPGPNWPSLQPLGALQPGLAPQQPEQPQQPQQQPQQPQSNEARPVIPNAPHPSAINVKNNSNKNPDIPDVPPPPLPVGRQPQQQQEKKSQS